MNDENERQNLDAIEQELQTMKKESSDAFENDGQRFSAAGAVADGDETVPAQIPYLNQTAETNEIVNQGSFEDHVHMGIEASAVRPTDYPMSNMQSD